MENTTPQLCPLVYKGLDWDRESGTLTLLIADRGTDDVVRLTFHPTTKDVLMWQHMADDLFERARPDDNDDE